MELTESYFLGRVVSEQSDMGFFFFILWIFHVATYP